MVWSVRRLSADFNAKIVKYLLSTARPLIFQTRAKCVVGSKAQSQTPSSLRPLRLAGYTRTKLTPLDFIYDNLVIEVNIIEAAFRAQVPKLMFLGSCCIYPKYAEQPISEDALLSGPARANKRVVCHCKDWRA